MSGPGLIPICTCGVVCAPLATTKKTDKATDGDRMFPDVPMEFMNPIAIARLELERANVLLIHVNKTTFATCPCAMKKLVEY
jgi:hypothetical protein